MSKLTWLGFMAIVVSSILTTPVLVCAYPHYRDDARGVITDISMFEGREGSASRVMIEGTLGPATQVGRIGIDVTAQTKVFIKGRGGRRKASFADLKKGQRIEIRFTGPVRKSYPPQITAAEITIIRP